MAKRNIKLLNNSFSNLILFCLVLQLMILEEILFQLDEIKSFVREESPIYSRQFETFQLILIEQPGQPSPPKVAVFPFLAIDRGWIPRS